MNRHPRDPADADAPVLSAQGWSVGLFCAECSHHWTGAAPCTHCGRFSRPLAVACREVLCGRALLPWTWEKRYQFRAEKARAPSTATDTRPSEESRTPERPGGHAPVALG